MSRISVLSAFRASNGACTAALETTARSISIVGQQQRTFTSTSQRNAKNIVHFTPTSSPELDRTLSEIRTKIILPYYLPKVQRQRIYSLKWQKKLQADPITIEIDGEVIKFRYQDPMKDVPNTARSLLKAINLFETAEDFSNLRPLLEGMAKTDRDLRPDFWAMITRKAGMKGQIYQIIDCARSARATGYLLDTGEKINEILHWIQLKAVDAEWDQAETEQALRWAVMVVDMLEDEIHLVARQKAGYNPGREPTIPAAPMHLAAVLAARYEGDDKVVNLVQKYAKQIIQSWPENKKFEDLQPKAAPTEVQRPYEYIMERNKFVTLASPLLHSLDEAIKVVEPNMANQLQARRDILAEEIKEARKAIGPTTRGNSVYKKFYDDA